MQDMMLAFSNGSFGSDWGMYLLIGVLITQLLGILLILQVLTRINYIQRKIENRSHHRTEKTENFELTEQELEEDLETSPYDEFLQTHPEVLQLKNSERASRYREWRKKKGLTWSR